MLREGAVADPEVEAAVRTALGATYLSLGLLDEADGHLRRANATYGGLDDAPPLDVAVTRFHLAWLLRMQGEHDSAESMIDIRARLWDKSRGS